MSKPWGNIGAWAAEAERAEAEEREAEAAASSAGAQNFPSLKEAVSAKPKKKKMTLSEFTKGSYASGGGASESQGLTPDEMLRLPTGPKERSAEEMQFNRLGGGFASYGRSGPPMGRGRDSEGNGDGSWGGGRRSYGGFDGERRGPSSRVSEFDQPSRADEVDNWASVKKPLPSLDSGRQNRYGSLGSGGGGSGGGFTGGSRADEVDNWAVTKKPIPARSSTFGSGFRDSGVEQDRWTGGAPRESERERPRLLLDPPRGDGSTNEVPAAAKTNRPNPFGAARPREEVLAEKGLDWKKMESELDAKKTSRPSSAHSSRPSSAQSGRSEGQGLQQGTGETAVKPRPKVNPFGDAKPREVLLVERGIDWRKVDLELEHRSVDRSETEEEKLLKEEIDNLKKELEESTINSNNESLDETGAEQINAREILLQKERELELLIRDLDDKVRFGQKAVDRPGSSAGKSSVFSDAPPSQSGSFDDSRGEFTDRPRSRGTGDMWVRPSDDRRPFQGSRDRGGPSNDRRPFQGSRDRGGPSDDRRPFQGSRDRGGPNDDRRSFQGSWDRGGPSDDRRSFQGSGARGGPGDDHRSFQGSRDRGGPSDDRRSFQGSRDRGGPSDDRRSFQGSRDRGWPSDDRRSFQGSGDRGGPSDDQKSFQGSRDRGGFLSSRDLNRSRSKERW